MIGVLGAGSWGTALAIVLATKHPDQIVPVWGHDPEHQTAMHNQRENKRYLPGVALPSNLTFMHNLAEVISMVDDLLIVVPSHVFILVLEQIKPHLNRHHRLVWATKGLEKHTGQFLHQVVENVLGNRIESAVLSGPSFAKEVANGLPTAVTIASGSEQFSQDLIKYFHTKYFRVYLNTDMLGVQLGGVVKNILAVAAGIADGLQFGANARAALLTRGLVEMEKLGQALGAKAATMRGLSGVGDVILSATDNQSRNKRFGMALAAGKDVITAQQEIGQVVEAVHNAAALYKLAQQYGVEVPIIEQVHLILQQQTTPSEAVETLLTRQPVYE